MLKRRCPECDQPAIDVLSLYHAGDWDWPVICGRCGARFEVRGLGRHDRYVYLGTAALSAVAVLASGRLWVGLLVIGAGCIQSLRQRFIVRLHPWGIRKYLDKPRSRWRAGGER